MNSDKPFGAQERRSAAPIVIWGALLLAWFGVLVWMASSQAHPIHAP